MALCDLIPFTTVTMNSIYATKREENPKLYIHPSRKKYLVEWVGARSPVGQEQTKTDSLEDTANSTDSNCVEGTLLGEDLGYDL